MKSINNNTNNTHIVIVLFYEMKNEYQKLINICL